MVDKEPNTVVLESGIEVKPIYSQKDISKLDFDKEIGEPGIRKILWASVIISRKQTILIHGYV